MNPIDTLLRFGKFSISMPNHNISYFDNKCSKKEQEKALRKYCAIIVRMFLFSVDIEKN